MNNTELLEKIKNSSCALLGLGVSGHALIEFLLEIGVSRITVHDRKDVSELGDDAKAYAEKGVNFVTG